MEFKGIQRLNGLLMVNQLIIREEEQRRILWHGLVKEQVHHLKRSLLLNLKIKLLKTTLSLLSLEKKEKNSKLSKLLLQLMIKEHSFTPLMLKLLQNMEFLETKLSSLENSKSPS